jgi:Ala-tRNA(Pro) deacylase
VNTPTPDQEIMVVLDRLGIAYTRRDHPAVYTVEQARQFDGGIPGAHCKNLFLRNKKGDSYFLAVFDERTLLDLRELGRRVNVGPLGFASSERLERILGLSPGAVGPFGLIDPAARGVTVLLDQSLASSGYVSFHPNLNTATLTIRFSDFLRYLEYVGNPLVWIEIT